MKIFLLSVFTALSLLAIAQPVLAQNTNTDQCNKLKQQINNAGGGDITNSLPIYCSPSAIYQKILNILYYALGIASVVALIYGGYMYVTARGNAIQAKRGRTIVIWALVGLAIAILAAVIVDIVVKFVVENR